MDTKWKIGFGLLLFGFVTELGVTRKLAAEVVELEQRYSDLYEMAAYLAGKAASAGFELDEEDMSRMKELKPA
jgi:hypothetical protein